MNPTLYQMANCTESIRVVLQKKTNGSFLLGISNGKHKPLICQGIPDDIDKELQTRLPAYLDELQTAEIEAKLNAAVQVQISAENTDDDEPEENAVQTGTASLKTPISLPTPILQPASAVSAPTELPELNDQPELDFGF